MKKSILIDSSNVHVLTSILYDIEFNYYSLKLEFEKVYFLYSQSTVLHQFLISKICSKLEALDLGIRFKVLDISSLYPVNQHLFASLKMARLERMRRSKNIQYITTLCKTLNLFDITYIGGSSLILPILHNSINKFRCIYYAHGLSDYLKDNKSLPIKRCKNFIIQLLEWTFFGYHTQLWIASHEIKKPIFETNFSSFYKSLLREFTHNEVPNLRAPQEGSNLLIQIPDYGGDIDQYLNYVRAVVIYHQKLSIKPKSILNINVKIRPLDDFFIDDFKNKLCNFLNIKYSHININVLVEQKNLTSEFLINELRISHLYSSLSLSLLTARLFWPDVAVTQIDISTKTLKNMPKLKWPLNIDTKWYSSLKYFMKNVWFFEWPIISVDLDLIEFYDH